MASLRQFSRALLSVGIVMMTLFAGSSVAHAASWVRATSPTTSDLFGVSCVTVRSCVAVGKIGTILYTSDGKTWTSATSGTTVTLTDVFAYSSSKIFAVGNSGTILKSADGGVTWTAMTSGTTDSLTSVFFASSNIGWATGSLGTVLKTTDGGTTWVIMTTLSAPLHDIDASSTSVVWAVGDDGSVFRAIDGGTTWFPVFYTPVTTNDLMSINVLSSSTAYVAGENGLFAKTTDSGTTWTHTTLTGFSSLENVTGTAWYSSTGGTVVGSAGSLLTTTDGGTTFTADSKSFYPVDVASITIPSVNYRYFVGRLGVIGTYDYYGPGAPATVALTSGVSYTNDTTPSLTWGAAIDSESSVSSYQLQVDSGSWSSVGDVLTSSLTSALSVGSHSVAVRGVDAAGNVGTSRSVTFTVETTAPTVDVISPTSATAGTAMTFSAGASDATSGISSCSMLVNGSSVGAMTWSNTLAKYAISYSFPSAGSYSVQMSCTDVAGNTASGTAVTVTVSAATTADVTAPTVGQISQTTATQNVALTLSATVSDNVGISSCSLYVGGSYIGVMSVSNGTASYSYTFGSIGSYSVYVTCVDTSGNIGTGSSRTVTVSSASILDTTAPTVGQILQTLATKNVATTLSATVSDAVALSSCSLYTNGSYVGVMSISGGTASYSPYIFTSTGSFTAYVTCVDTSGNIGTGSSQTITVSADTTAPSVGQITQTTATKSAVTTLSATESDSVGVSSCSLYVGGSYIGAMTLSGGTASYSYTFGSTGSYSAYVTCVDASGNTGTGSSRTITVSTDTTAPSVGQISQTTASQNVAMTLSATVTDNVGISSCSLYINSSYIGLLNVSGSTASLSHTFTATGSYSVYMTCLDAVANVGVGAMRTVSVSAVSTTEAKQHDLLKLACTTSSVNDPCTAVYYYGDDGYRHAFPNANVYYTWYTSFDSVKIVSSSFMASLTIGRNVTYHPGTKMVKFTTVNTVYAVGTAGELRAIQSEELAQSLYGSTWNKQIDDISDAFHGNYTFGEIIDTTSDFSPSAVKSGSTSIEDVI